MQRLGRRHGKMLQQGAWKIDELTLLLITRFTLHVKKHNCVSVVQSSKYLKV